MNRKNIQAAAIGVTAGVMTVAGIIAWDEMDPVGTIRRATERRHLTPAEREEWDALQAQRLAESAEHAGDLDDKRQAALAKFRPEMLTVAKVDQIDQLTVPELLTEIAAAHTAHRAQWVLPYGERDHAAMKVWNDQIEALTEHFRQLNTGKLRRPRQLSALDCRRLERAHISVYDYSRWMPPRSMARQVADARNQATPVTTSIPNTTTDGKAER